MAIKKYNRKKILWFTGFVLPQYCAHFGLPVSHGGGWLTGTLNELQKRNDVEVSICSIADVHKTVSKSFESTVKSYYLIPKPHNMLKYDDDLESRCIELLKQCRPDVIHVYGTEFPHNLAMVNAAEKLNMIDKVVVNLQGLATICAQHCMSNIKNDLRWYNPKDWSINVYLLLLRKHFLTRSKFEKELLKKVKHVIGRTTWDMACSNQQNLEVHYHFCNETLRSSFYEKQWNYDRCERYSIFVSQANSPIKGLHFMLKAMPIVLERFPEAKLYIAGNDIFRTDSIKARLKSLSYTAYLKRLIKKNRLQDKVLFTGQLSEEGMCKKFLDSHIFVSASLVENESNSLSEAKILGVPCVASYVGGVTDRIEQGVDGFHYQHDAPYMLAHYICKLFEDRHLADRISRTAREKVTETVNKELNCSRLLDIYSEIINN